jgi:hypothetical protein
MKKQTTLVSVCIPVNVTTHSGEADQGVKRTEADCLK